ncbi:MAG: hypothetical protein U1D30_16640 [Planctomycetota bacterium]
MKKALSISAALLAMLLATAEANAQQFQRGGSPRQSRQSYRPPVTSPYINLLSGGSNPSVVYQGIVLPQLEQQQFDRLQSNNIQRINADVANNRQMIQQESKRTDKRFNQLAVDLGTKPAMTGTRTRFMSRSDFFPGLR